MLQVNEGGEMNQGFGVACMHLSFDDQLFAKKTLEQLKKGWADEDCRTGGEYTRGTSSNRTQSEAAPTPLFARPPSLVGS